jgi:hypothetical protein
MTAGQDIVAIVADCDDTLAPDTTGQLLKSFGVDPETFFKKDAGSLVDQGFDPALAYLNAMIRRSGVGGKLAGLTRSRVAEQGKKLKFFPGMPKAFEKLSKEFHVKYGKKQLALEVYVISGGIRDLLAASPLASVTKDLWGCNFDYDSKTGRINGIKNAISFTEKTKFLFHIQKGLVGPEFENRFFDVNKPMLAEERRVPFENMIYLGDGPSDIPCMSIIMMNGGFVIGILGMDKPGRAWELGFGRRANITVPADFRPGKLGYIHLREAAFRIADRILVDRKAPGGVVPKYPGGK